MTEEHKTSQLREGGGSRLGLQIYERDPLNEPSMQMESMVELEGIDQIGADPEQQALNYSQFSRRQSDN